MACLRASEKYFSNIMNRAGYILMRWWWSQLCTRPTHLVNSLKQILRVDMSLHSDTLSWFRVNQSLFMLHNAASLAEKQQTNINIKIFSLTWLGVKPTIYCTWSKHANHYTTSAVEGMVWMQVKLKGNFLEHIFFIAVLHLRVTVKSQRIASINPEVITDSKGTFAGLP